MSKLNDYLVEEAGWNDYTSNFYVQDDVQANTPTLTDMGNGFYEYLFATSDVAFIKFHIKHDILVGSKVYPHIHWTHSANMGQTDTVVWEVSYIYAAGHQQGASLTDTATTMTLTYESPLGTEIDGEHMVTECSDQQAFDAPEVDSIVLMRVERVAGTYTGSVYGLTADLHYQIGSISTPNKAPDFYA